MKKIICYALAIPLCILGATVLCALYVALMEAYGMTGEQNARILVAGFTSGVVIICTILLLRALRKSKE